MSNNLSVLKQSVYDGGQYEEIRVFAETQFTGPIHATKIDVYDEAVFDAAISVKKLNVNGSAVFNGPVTALEITINGTVIFNDIVKTNKLTVKNQVNANLKVESYETQIDGRGYFTELDGYQLTVNGQITVVKLLRCNNITITKQARGKLSEVLSALVSITPELFFDEEGHKVLIDDLLAYDVTIKHSYIRHVKARVINQDEHSQIDEIDYIKP